LVILEGGRAQGLKDIDHTRLKNEFANIRVVVPTLKILRSLCPFTTLLLQKWDDVPEDERPEALNANAH
jgi:hypothetical protein